MGPGWRDAGDEWQAFLGKGDDIFAFESVADLAAFVRTDTDNDLSDHPAWERLTKTNAHRLQPAENRQADLIGVEELLAGKPSKESVDALASTLAVVSSIGSVCELPTVTRFFNGNPNLGLLMGGIEQFSGRAGRKRWNAIGETVARGWDGVISAIDEILTTPPVDGAPPRPPPPNSTSRTTRPRTRAPSRCPPTRTARTPTRTPTRACPAAARLPGDARRRLPVLGARGDRPGSPDDQRRHALHPALLLRRQADLPGP